MLGFDCYFVNTIADHSLMVNKHHLKVMKDDLQKYLNISWENADKILYVWCDMFTYLQQWFLIQPHLGRWGCCCLRCVFWRKMLGRSCCYYCCCYCRYCCHCLRSSCLCWHNYCRCCCFASAARMTSDARIAEGSSRPRSGCAPGHCKGGVEWKGVSGDDSVGVK